LTGFIGKASDIVQKGFPVPNVLLTTRCNRSCPYCFATKEMSSAVTDSLMSWENLIYIADFFKASGQQRISLLGGEPTLHPECVDFILYLLERDFEVMVFTNGMLTSSRLQEFKRYLADANNQKLSFVCNLNDPVQTPGAKGEMERIEAFLALMGPRVTPGFNIYRLDFNLEFVFDAINRFGLKRHLRLGVCHPMPGKSHGFIRPEDMRQVVQRLYSYREYFDSCRVTPGLDCGFPLCQFKDEELGWLQHFRSSVHFRCGPALDITPDMSVYYCFPLCDYQRKSLFEFDSLKQLDEHFIKLRQEIRAEIPGIFDECDGCRFQEEEVCGGGGLCQILNRFMSEAPIREAEIEHELAKHRLSS
jgi:hypothetical protein